MKLSESELSARLENLDLTECGFCHRRIAADEVLVAGEADDGSAKTAGFCCLERLATTWRCDLPDTRRVAAAFLNADQRRKAGLEDGNTRPVKADSSDEEMAQELLQPGWYLDHEVLEYAEYPPPEYWLPEVHAAAQQAQADGKGFLWVTWPDGVQVKLAAYEEPGEEMLVRAYRNASLAMMTHRFLEGKALP
jgi:hypothetical protein